MPKFQKSKSFLTNGKAKAKESRWQCSPLRQNLWENRSKRTQISGINIRIIIIIDIWYLICMHDMMPGYPWCVSVIKNRLGMPNIKNNYCSKPYFDILSNQAIFCSRRTCKKSELILFRILILNDEKLKIRLCWIFVTIPLYNYALLLTILVKILFGHDQLKSVRDPYNIYTLVHYMLPAALEYPSGDWNGFRVNRPAREGSLREHFGGYKTIHRIPLPLILNHLRWWVSLQAS